MSFSQDSLQYNFPKKFYLILWERLNLCPIKVPFWKLQAEATSNNYDVSLDPTQFLKMENSFHGHRANKKYDFIWNA